MPANSDDSCIFCWIANRPDHWSHEVIWENERFTAFLDRFPNTYGATVLITKAHHGSRILRCSQDVLHGFVDAAAEVEGILLTAFPDIDRVGIASDGFGVDHAHIKIYPLHGTRDLATNELVVIRSPIKNYYTRYPGYLATNASEAGDAWELHDLGERLRAVAAA